MDQEEGKGTHWNETIGTNIKWEIKLKMSVISQRVFKTRPVICLMVMPKLVVLVLFSY